MGCSQLRLGFLDQFSEEHIKNTRKNKATWESLEIYSFNQSKIQTHEKDNVLRIEDERPPKQILVYHETFAGQNQELNSESRITTSITLVPVKEILYGI